MKTKEVYVIYFNGDKIGMFEKYKDCKRYVEYLDFYKIDKYDTITYRREVIYVWYSDTIYGSIGRLNTWFYRGIFNIWFYG